MKKIYNIFLLAATIMLSLTGCTSDEPFITAGPDDTPRFLFPSSIEGSVTVSRSQTREDVFVFPNKATDDVEEIVVTPANYVTIEWISDGQVLGTGTKFSKQFEAGDYEITIKATTQAGKVATRTVKLSVSALADDPKINSKEKNRWLNPGNVITIEGENLADVKVLIFTPVKEEAATRAEVAEDGSIQLPCEAAADGKSVAVTLPADMVKGNYRVSAVKDNGERFGCGLVTVTDEEYVDPGVNVIYEGPSEKLAWNAIVWEGEEYAKLGITPGMTITVYVNADADAAGAIATGWWNDINTGVKWDDPEGGCRQELPQGQSVMTYTVTTTEFMEEQGFAVIGNNFVVEKITLEEPAETVIYEGPSDKLAWNAITWSAEDFPKLGIHVGTVITVYYVADEGAAGAIATSWWKDINTGIQWDEPEGGCRQELPAGSGKMEYEVTTLDYLNEQGFGVVGNAYVIERITIK